MSRKLDYPCPEKLLIESPLFGEIYFVDGKMLNALTSNEISTRGVTLEKCSYSYCPCPENAMFYVFNVEIPGGTGSKIGASGKDQTDAEKRLRSKLGLSAESTVSFLESFPDANSCTFEEVRGNTVKKGGDDSTEAMQKNVENQKPVQGETDPSAPNLPPEGSPGNMFDPSGSAQPTENS